jgi:AcrR family transcriptional regulator
MGRWEPDARGRLERAAMELYAERGFEQTTVAEIAKRAGLTERTFFRHFADKREVLFAGAQQLQNLLVGALAAAPPGDAPMEAIAVALHAAADLFDERRPFAQERSRIIAAHPDLQERELIKMSTLAVALAATLRERGVPEPAASLGGQAGIAVFHVSFARWIADPEDSSMWVHMQESLEELRSVTAGFAPGVPSAGAR